MVVGLLSGLLSPVNVETSNQCTFNRRPAILDE